MASVPTVRARSSVCIGRMVNVPNVCVCRYRKFDLGNDIELISRCEHDAAAYGPNGELQFLNIKTLNEWDPRVSV